MPDPVHGRNVSLSMLVGLDYFPVLCGTDCTFTRTPEFITKTGPNSGLVRQFMLRLEEFTSTITGLTKIENDVSLSFFYMLQTGIRREEQTFQLIFQDEEGNLISITGPALIGQMDINGPTTSFSNAGIELKWNDLPVMDTIPAPVFGGGDPDVPGLERIYIPIVIGAVSVQDDVLIGATVLQVRRNGRSQNPTTGTPGNDQFKFDSALGRVYTDAAVPYEATESPIYVLYKT